MRQAENEASLEMSETLVNEKIYLAIIKDPNALLGSQRRALNDLIAIDPVYLSGLNLTNVATKEGKKLLEDYNKQLKLSFTLQALKRIALMHQEKAARLEALSKDIDAMQQTQSDPK